MTAVFVESGPDAGVIWHFGEPNHEQRALDAGTGWADLSHRSIITVSGVDRLTWLNDLTTQEIAKLAPHTWISALILDAQGHIQHQLVLLDDGEKVWIHTEKSAEDSLIAFLQKMVFMLRVEPKVVSTEFALLRIPGLSDDMGGPYQIIERSQLAARTTELNEKFMQVGSWALEAERVAQHRARLNFETDYKSIPNELGFLNNAVHMRKGCYPGQETVAKVFNLGHPPRRLVLLHLDGSVVTMPEHGAKVFNGEKEVGFLGTLARHHELGPIALAVIRRTTPVDATLTVEGVPANQEVIVPAE
jgi:hypothetical protein